MKKSWACAQAISVSQQVAWVTGTQTSTPVFVFVKGDEHPLPKNAASYPVGD
jgi:hypothetical protein